MGTIGSILGIGTGIINNAGQNKRNERAYKQQEKLMGVQFENQQELNKQGKELQLEMWKETNYPAQMEMIKDAGLNAGLIYGSGGAGGATTGSQSGGSAASGNAPQQMPMELGTALQAAMIESNIELAKANANKANAEASNIKGEEGTIGESQISKLIAETKNEKLKGLLMNTERLLKSQLFDKALEETLILSKDRYIKDSTYKQEIKGIQLDIAGKILENELTNSKKELNEQQKEQVKESIIQRWFEIGINGVGKLIDGILKGKILNKVDKKI